jgi:arylsulfate sulfotransferase
MIQQTAGRMVLTWLTAAILTIPRWSHAVTLLSGPTFSPATNAPLAGRLQLTTDVNSRISVLVDDGTDSWEKDFYDYTTNHSVPLLGFKPNQTNQILVTVYDTDRNSITAPQLLTFVTPPLPADFPVYTVLTNNSSMMEPGYMLFMMANRGGDRTNYVAIMDNSGDVVWYTPISTVDSEARQLEDGNLFVEQQTPSNNFVEIDMLGETVRTLYPPAQYPVVNTHEGLVTDHGTLLYLSDVKQAVTNFPTSDTNSNPTLETTNVDDNPIVEISYTNGAFLNAWSPLNLIDPTRVTYLTYGTASGSPVGVDSEHANAIIDDTNDNSIIVSLRNQNAICKFSRSTGQLKWILGPPALWGTNWQPYLLTPVGEPFDWNYGQHAPELTPEGTLLVYNDNNYQASPFDVSVPDLANHSSAIEYAINEQTMTVSEVWNSCWQSNQARLFTPYVGRVQWLPQTRNVLVDYGAVTYINGSAPNLRIPNASMVRFMEYTHDPVPQVVFDVSFFQYTNNPPNYMGYICYRAYQIPDLYVHPAQPVADLTVSNHGQIPLLEFSADPTRNYLIQASTDLMNWTTVGTPVQEGGTGDYDFEDLNANQFTTRFYRVVTQ